MKLQVPKILPQNNSETVESGAKILKERHISPLKIKKILML